MNILLRGYIDRNFGDDLMLRLAADGLKNHTAQLDVPKDMAEHYKKLGFNIYGGVDYNAECTVAGSWFVIRSKTGLLYRTKEIISQKRRGTKKVILGCNISDFTVSGAETLIRRHIAAYDFITVRDSFSYDYIRKNIPSVKCEYYPDIAFSLPDSMIYDTPREGALGITAYRGLGGDEAVYEKLAYAADRFIEKTGKKVLLFAFDLGLENDLKAAENIAFLCKNKEKTEIITNTGDDILKNLPRCSKLIAVRLHGVILALRMGIPVIPVAYSNKTNRVLNDLNYDGPILDLHGFGAEEAAELAVSYEEPFALPKDVKERASMHIKRFSEELAD